MKLIVLKGLPGSGKSTLAEERLKKDGNAVRVCRDDLRAMVHRGLKWSGARERTVIDIETAIAFNALSAGKNVIVDDTNILGKGYHLWKDACETWRKLGKDIEFEVVDFTPNSKTPVTIQECIRRDSLRTGTARVGRGVIERMALFGELIDLSPFDKVAIVDIDGTLSCLDHRLKYIESTPKDYDKFFATVCFDGWFHSVWAAVRTLANTGHLIIVLSGRTASCGHATAEWLEFGNPREENKDGIPLPYDHLFMRQSGDKKPDHEAKREIFDAMLRAGLRKDSIKVVIDDRDSVCDLWRSLELPLIQVDRGKAIEIEASAIEISGEIGLTIGDCCGYGN